MIKLLSTTALAAGLALVPASAWAQTSTTGGPNTATDSSTATNTQLNATLTVADSGNDSSTNDSGNTDFNNNSSTTDNSIDVADSGNDNRMTDNSIDVADSGNDNRTTDNSIDVADSGNDNRMTDNSLDIADSGNDSSTNDSGNDNSIDVADSGNDSSDNSTRASNNTLGGSDAAIAGTSNLFGNGAMVASATLASHVSGVTVRYRGGEGGNTVDNSLSNAGSAFQNFAGMQALNQNTGVGATQNAAVSVAVSTGDIAF